MFLLGWCFSLFSHFAQREAKSLSHEKQLEGEACQMSTCLPGTVWMCRDPPKPRVFLRYILPVRVLLIDMILPDVLVCLVAEFHGGICNRTVAQMVIILLLCWPQRGIIHRGIITHNTVWGRMNLRAPGKECGVKTRSGPPVAFWLVIAVRGLPDSCRRPR